MPLLRTVYSLSLMILLYVIAIDSVTIPNINTAPKTDEKLSVRLCIEHDSDSEMYWSMYTIYVPSSTPVYQLITDDVREKFDYRVSECPLVLMAGSHLVPESMTVGDLNPMDRSALLVTRSMVDAEVVWRQKDGAQSLFVVNLSDGFNYAKLKSAIARKTELPVEKQYVRFDGDMENRKTKGLENPVKDAEISSHFHTLLAAHFRFVLEEVDPIVIQVGTQEDVPQSEQIVSPKLTSQRLAQDMSIEDKVEVSYKTHCLTFEGRHMMLSSPYGFVCTDPRPDSTLGGYGVKNGSFLLFKERDRSRFMTVKLVSGGQYQLDGYTTDDFVADIMWEVADRKHWEWPDPMRLISGAHNLDHLKQLKEYDGINQDSPIHMVPRMRRG